MRQLKSLSYSALSRWEQDPETFYLERLTELRTKRDPQGPPAAIGSAFDARVKHALSQALFGGDAPANLNFETLFELQVEEQNRDRVLDDSRYLFERYVSSGAYNALLDELTVSPIEPRFEFELLAHVEGVPITVKPDLAYGTPDGAHVIFDWKVKSFYSKSGASPTKGYRRLRGDGDKTHKLYRPMQYGGMQIHNGCLSQLSEDYADQTCLYAKALQCPDDFIASIDELVCRPVPGGVPGPPAVRVSELRAQVQEQHQDKLLQRLRLCWWALTNEHVFIEKTLDQSRAMQRMLDETAKNIKGDDDAAYYASMGKKSWY